MVLSNARFEDLLIMENYLRDDLQPMRGLAEWDPSHVDCQHVDMMRHYSPDPLRLDDYEMATD